MARLRFTGLRGELGFPLTDSDTVIESDGLIDMPVIAAPDYAVLVLDPHGMTGRPEVVYLIEHDDGDDHGTITRGQETGTGDGEGGAAARAHAEGVEWVHGGTAADFGSRGLNGITVDKSGESPGVISIDLGALGADPDADGAVDEDTATVYLYGPAGGGVVFDLVPPNRTSALSLTVVATNVDSNAPSFTVDTYDAVWAGESEYAAILLVSQDGGAMIPLTPPSSAGASLIPTAVKTSAYTAAAGDYVPVSTTGGTVAITLPASPAVGDEVQVKRVAGTSNVATVVTQGSHVFNVAGGGTTATLTLLNQHFTFVYAGSNIWLVETSLTLSTLDARFGASYYQSAAPTGTIADGAIWTDSDDGSFYTRVSGSWVQVGA